MANRQTKRERKALAKQRRLEEMRRAARRRRMQKLTSLALVLVVVAGIGALVWLGGRADRSRVAELNTLAAAAGCDPVEKPADKGREHINYPAKGDYSSNPPTSGSHYYLNSPPAGAPQSPADTGLHSTPIQNEVQVHNLEHGHAGIQYTDQLDAEVLEALKSLMTDPENAKWTFIAPRPEIAPRQLVLTSWRHLVACTSPTDPVAVKALADELIEEFTNKHLTPENIPGTPSGETREYLAEQEGGASPSPSPDATATTTESPSPSPSPTGDAS